MKPNISKLLKSQWLRAVAFWSIIFIAVIVAAQFILPKPNTIRSKFYEEIFDPCYASKDGSTYMPQREDHHQPTFPGFKLPKPADTYRIFIVGGSVPYNLGNSVYTEVFKLMVGEIYPGKKIELIDAAVPGYDSCRVLRVLREIINYSPDCIIIMSGNNEFYNQKLSIKDYLLYKLKNIRIFNLSKNIPYGPATAKGTPRTRQQRLADYSDNISNMVKLAKKHAPRTIICTIPLNRQACAPIDDFPPDKNFIQASVALWNNDLNSAQQAIRRFIATHLQHPLGYLRLGQILEAKGQTKKARIFFDHVVDLDFGKQSRACFIVNTIIRNLAKKENIGLADMEQEFVKLNELGYQDIDIYTDNCHMNDIFRKYMFNCLLKTMSDNAPQINIRVKNDNDRRSWFTSDPAIQDDSFLSDHAFLKIKLAIYTHPEERLDTIIDDYDKDIAIFLTPTNWDIMDMHFGEAFRRMGKKELALKYLNRALKNGLQSGPLFISLALIADSENDYARARDYWQKAIRYSKNNSDALVAQTFKSVIEQK